MGRGDSLNVLIPSSHVYGLILIGLREEKGGVGFGWGRRVAMRKLHIAINRHYLCHPRTQLFQGFRDPLATVYIVVPPKKIFTLELL